MDFFLYIIYLIKLCLVLLKSIFHFSGIRDRLKKPKLVRPSEILSRYCKITLHVLIDSQKVLECSALVTCFFIWTEPALVTCLIDKKKKTTVRPTNNYTIRRRKLKKNRNGVVAVTIVSREVQSRRRLI